MSGGEKKKKNTRSQGWEEAGSEFYQESYPGDAEIEVLQKDPKRLATLLPSKQTRAAAATIRIRTNDTRTNKSAKSTIRSRYTGQRVRKDSTVHRRTSTVGDVQVSMLPDLSEMNTNEMTAWEEIMQIKAMPVPMGQKKDMKARILNEPNLRLQGYEQFKWKRRKAWRQFEARLKESYSKLELWRGDIKNIEGDFGTGVVAFFLFLKWLLMLNCFIFLLIFLFITLPTILLLDTDTNSNCSLIANNSIDCCAQSYFNESTSKNNIVLDFIQGTGSFEKTLLFYGFYSDNIYEYFASDSIIMYYNIPLAYVLVTILYFLVSFVSILRTAAKGFRERLVEGEGQFYQYCNYIFGGWDFCINNEKAAHSKHKAIYTELKAMLESDKLMDERQNRSRNERYKLIFIRCVVNSLVVAVLALCACGIYFIFDISTSQLNTKFTNTSVELNFDKKLEQLVYQFLPSVSIEVLNMFVPFLFSFLIKFESFSPGLVLRITLFRTILLRLASLIVLYASMYSNIKCEVSLEDDECVSESCKTPVCWETYVGQQIYKLLLTTFASQIVLTFFVNFVRALLAKHVGNKFFKYIGEQTFDLPEHVLNVVYIQTLCWFGIFYAPLLSALATVLFFLLFYVKKFACVVNCVPSSVIYRASRSNSMFMVVLLISYLVAIIPIAFSVAEIVPSRSCGPFRGLSSVWTLIVESFTTAPNWIQSIVSFLNTAGFVIPVLILILLLLYYYAAVNAANRHMVSVLKNQLVLEGHDKQFLLDRLTLFVKQENQKRQRMVDHSVSDRNSSN